VSYLLVLLNFSSLLGNHGLFVSRYKKHYAAQAMRRKKPMRQKHYLLHLFMGKIEHRESIGKFSPA